MITVKQGLPTGEYSVHVSTVTQELDGKVERDSEGNLTITTKEAPFDGFVVITLGDDHKSSYSGVLTKGVFSHVNIPADYKQATPTPLRSSSITTRTSVPVSESIDYNEETEND